jgi:hypothetical protein
MDVCNPLRGASGDQPPPFFILEFANDAVLESTNFYIVHGVIHQVIILAQLLVPHWS